VKSSDLDGSQGQAPIELAGGRHEGPSFACSVQRRDGIVVLALQGELDVAVAESVERAALEILDGSCRHLVMDLRALEFLDSAGLRALLRIREHAGPSVQFELVKGPPTIARVFELTGLTSALPFRDAPQ
jgi:anti-sigma B factor antagonist